MEEEQEFNEDRKEFPLGDFFAFFAVFILVGIILMLTGVIEL